MQASRFTWAAVVVSVLGCVVAFVGPLALGAGPGFRGSITLSAVVGAVFAGKNLQTVRDRGHPRFAAAVLATAIGTWLILAPLQYEAVGGALTAVTQFGGMCLAAFSAYTALVAVEYYLGEADVEADETGYA